MQISRREKSGIHANKSSRKKWNTCKEVVAKKVENMQRSRREKSGKHAKKSSRKKKERNLLRSPCTRKKKESWTISPLIISKRFLQEIL